MARGRGEREEDDGVVVVVVCRGIRHLSVVDDDGSDGCRCCCLSFSDAHWLSFYRHSGRVLVFEKSSSRRRSRGEPEPKPERVADRESVARTANSENGSDEERCR